MQVYRGMDIGTAKPTAAEQAEVRHHLIDLTDPDDDYTVAAFQAAFRAAMADIEARGKRAVLVGGTALYLRAVVDDLTLPGQHPDARAAIEAEPDTAAAVPRPPHPPHPRPAAAPDPATAALHARLAVLAPAAAPRREPTNRRRIVRALEVTEGSGRPFSSSGPGLDTSPPTPFT